MPSTDFYDRLGIPLEASEEEIRKAYFKAAQMLHPDVNVEAGATELFLDIKQAYETLIDPAKRKVYDGKSKDVPKPPVRFSTHFSRETLPWMEENQLVYALLEMEVIADLLEVGDDTNPPVNISLVLDCSTSMQGERLTVLKATAIELIRQLRPQDILSVVAFYDRAEIILPSTSQANNLKNEGRIRALQARGGTEIYQGLQAGVVQVHNNLSPYYVNHVILVTDGHTYGDEAKCQQLAKKAADHGIGISCLGIGGKWNDVFLDIIATTTGGGCFYVSDPRDIRVFLKEKFSDLGQVVVEGITLNYREGPGVNLNYAYRLHPETNPLPLTAPIRLGNVPRNHHLSLILEFMITPIAPSIQQVLLMEGSLTFKVPGFSSKTQRIPLSLLRPTSPNTQQRPPSKNVIEAISRLTLFRMQDDAQKELTSGNYQDASARLQNMATHLLSKGEFELAKTTLREAENIQKSKKYTDEGQKRIKYGTQSLFLPDTGRWDP